MTDAELQELLEQVRAQTEALERLTDVMRSSTQTKSSAATFTDKSARAIIEKSSNELNRQISSIVNKNLANITGIAKSATMAKKEARTTARSQGKSAAEISAAGAKAAVPHMEKLAKVSAVLGAGFGGLAVGAKKFSSELAAGTLKAGGVADSFGSVVSSVTNVTKSFGPLGFALSTATNAIVSFGIAAAKQGDMQSDVFEKLAEVGANTVGGFGDINKMLDQFGLATKDANKAMALIAGNAPALALYAGNAAEGAKAFAGIQGMIADSGLRREFKLMGIGYEQQRQAQVAYMSVMSRAGLSQNKTVAQLAAGAAEYLKEQDRLTRATGATAAEQEAARNSALAEEQFRTRNYRLSQGTEEDKKQAEKELATYNLITQMAGKDAARQFGASLDGIITDINKGAAILTQGASLDIATNKTLSPEEQAEAYLKALRGGVAQGTAGEAMGRQGQFQSTFGINQDELLKKLSAPGTVQERLAKAEKDQKTLVEDPTKGVKGAVNTAENVIKSMRDIENATQIAVDGMQEFGSKLTWLSKKITGLFPKDESVGGSKISDTASNMAISAVPGAPALKWLYDKIPGYAVGGIASGDKSGHLAMLHGTEAVIPLAGGSIPVTLSGGTAGQGDVGSGPAFSKANEFAAQMDKVIKVLEDSNKYLSDIYDEIKGGATVGGAGKAADMTAAMNAHDKSHQHEPPTITPEAAKQLGAGLGSPLEDLKVTSGFGMRIDPITGKQAGHGGVDLAGVTGAAIKAPEAGTARVVGEAASGGYGNMVEILDSQGKVMHRMAHMSETMVKTGDKIEAGMQIGKVGSTGRSTGSHLHWEKFDPTTGMQVDPMAWLAEKQGKTPGFGTTPGGAAMGNPQAARRGQKYGATQVGSPADMATYMKTVAMLESGGDPNAKAGTSNGNYSSAGGLFQFLESSYEGVTGRKGSGAERFDPKKATEAMQKLTMMNKSQMEKGLGREVSGEDLYMGHFLGAGGATKFLKQKDQNPNALAADMMPTEAASNKSIYYKDKEGKQSRTMAEVHELMTDKYRKQQAAIQAGQKLPEVVAELGTGGMQLAAPKAGAAPAQPATATAAAQQPGAAPVTGFAPGAQQPAAQPTTLASMAQNVLGSIFGGGTAPAAGLAGPVAPTAGADMAGITAALQAQTAATQTAITSSMENMTTRLVASLVTSGGATGGDPAVPALLGDMISAQREQTAAINRLISVQTA